MDVLGTVGIHRSALEADDESRIHTAQAEHSPIRGLPIELDGRHTCVLLVLESHSHDRGSCMERTDSVVGLQEIKMA